MPWLRTGGVFAAASLVLLLSAAIGVHAEPMTDQAIDAAIPMPETANLPPPTAADFEAPGAKPVQSADTPETRQPRPDAAIAEQLKGLAEGKFDGIIANKQDRATIDAFYSGRDYGPLWITDGKLNARGNAAIAYLGGVWADGLDRADYPVPDFAKATDPAALADAEMRLTMSVITYVHHASIGRVHWSRVSGDIFYPQEAPNPADVLAAMVSAADVGQALAGYEPQHPAYLALKAKLAELRAGKAAAASAAIHAGAVLKIGMQDERVPRLRERLGVSGAGTIYDKALAEAVRKFQQRHNLQPTGTLTAATVEALNGAPLDRQADIIVANMERWRWAPHHLGNTFVIVNLPDYMLRVVQNGKQVWAAKIVDGKPTTPSPIMSAEMKSMTVNPTWNVPPSIVANEYLPLLRQDSTILARMGLNVTRNPDGTIHVSQPPGPNNALGQLRFNFPNKFLVYQHDSNEKYLFSRTMRASSHGCMRVEDPVKYAEVLLSIVRPGEGYSQDRIRRMFGNTEMEIRFPTSVPVHLTYQTAYVDDDGKLQFRDDIYGRDKALIAILKGNERKVADVPIERKENTVRRELLAMPDSAFGGSWGQNFFARLFSNPLAALAPPSPTQRGHLARRTDLH